MSLLLVGIITSMCLTTGSGPESNSELRAFLSEPVSHSSLRAFSSTGSERAYLVAWGGLASLLACLARRDRARFPKRIP